MNLKELDSFKLHDAVFFHDELNPVIFAGETMRPEVRRQLMLIAEDFIDHLGIQHLEIGDITISGSNAAYSYTKHSDIDLHILVDMNKLSDDLVYRELFEAKKIVYNDTHDITIGGYEVELYVQDSSKPVISLGEYSVMYDKWIRLPKKHRANLDQMATRLKFEKILKLAGLALKHNNALNIHNLLSTIKKYRQSGLDKHGEFGPENLAYKALRSKGVIQKLYDRLNKLHDKTLSLPESKINKKVNRRATDEDYNPNGTPPGPEFKPTMPAGTVRVDVSDLYDWYKLGQHVSNLKGLGKHDFGKGPPSTIISFGSEEEEHKYINDLEKTGLSTTDIDPVDPKQPKGMKRQKTDPTYNVSEASGYIPSEKEKNDPRFKTALTVDVTPNSIKDNAEKLGSKISRAGIPPLLRK
jgi:hypothetical protein